MIPVLSLQNLVSWAAQVTIIVVIGMAVPKILRIQHPRSHLAFCYALLLACVALPFIQPLQTAGSRGGGDSDIRRQSSLAPVFSAFENRAHVVATVIVAGVLLRLCVFVVGLLRIWHYRRSAIPFRFPKYSVLSACQVTHRDLSIGISAAEVGPVTMGWLRPTILLPASFLSLDESAQHAILCHELLHVTRNDWLATLAEECIGACLWFHPAIWWLLARVRLTREQVVDSDIVRLTSAREPYINALLLIAGIQSDYAVVPAAMFLRARQLAERLQLLLVERTSSRRRLAFSYASLTVILCSASWIAFQAFPLTAQPAPIADAALSAVYPTLQVFAAGDNPDSPRLIQQVAPQYSDVARLAGVHGTVVLEGVVGTDGRIKVQRFVQHLDPQLDRNAAAAVSQWRFEPARVQGIPFAATLWIEVTFGLHSP